MRKPAGRDLRYFRLHDRPAYHYRYRYTTAEPSALRDMPGNTRPTRVLFNKDNMADDAKRLLRLLNRSS